MQYKVLYFLTGTNIEGVKGVKRLTLTPQTPFYTLYLTFLVNHYPLHRAIFVLRNGDKVSALRVAA